MPVREGMVRKWCRLYRIWDSMKTRCRNQGHNSYCYYGEKGIQVCEEWQDYAVFRAWAILNGYAKHLTIDRKDADGNYEPSNCQWLTPRQQMWRCKQTKRITFNGVTMPSPAWAEKIGISAQMLRSRINHGWSIDDALMVSKGRRRDERVCQGLTHEH